MDGVEWDGWSGMVEQGDRARLDKARDVYLDSTWCSLQQGGARIDHHLNTIPPFHLVIRVDSSFNTPRFAV